jgi:hypothetical protein
MKVQIGVYNSDYSSMLTDLFESDELIPIPSVGDVVRVRNSQYFKVTAREIMFEDSNISVILKAEPDESGGAWQGKA